MCLENERNRSLNPTHREWKSEAKSTHIHMHLVGAGTGASRYGTALPYTQHTQGSSSCVFGHIVVVLVV